MFICLLVLMIALDCYVYCDNFNRRSILETTYEYCYTYKYPTEEVPEGGTPAYAETLRQTSYGYDLDVTMLGIDPGCPYFPEVAPPPKRARWSLPALWPRNSVWARAMCWCCGTK